MFGIRKHLPLPKLGGGIRACLARYVFDWVLPKGLPALSAFLLVRALLQAELDAAKIHALPKFGLNSMLAVLMDKIVGGYQYWALYALVPLLLIALVVWLLQYFQIKPMRKRKYKAHDTLAYWLLMTSASLLGLYLTPLALGAAIAFAGNIKDLQVELPIFTATAFILAFALYWYAYSETAQAEMLTIAVSSNNTTRDGEGTVPYPQMEAQLELAAKQMARAFDGLWSCQVLVDQKAASGLVVLGFRTMKAEWTENEREDYERVISSHRQFWTAHAYTFRLLGYAPPDASRRPAKLGR